MHNRGEDRGDFLSCFDKKFDLMLRRNVLPPSSGRLNLVSVACGMTGRRDCVHYVSVLGTIGLGLISRYSDSLRAGRFEDRIPAATKYSAPVQTGPVTHPAPYTMGTLSFPGVKRPGCGGDHPLTSRAEVKERGAIHKTPSGSSCPWLWRPLPSRFPDTIFEIILHS